MIVGLFLFLILTFIYFGHTGFFKKIYGVTDKLGLTSIAKSVAEAEKNITEEQYKLTPEEKAAEEQIKSAIGTMASGIQSCLGGQNCVCSIDIPHIPGGYAIRFVNDRDNAYLSVFKYKSRDYKTDYDEDYQGQIGVHFVSGATHKFEKANACMVVDLAEEWFGTDVKTIDIRYPAIGMMQLYWEDKTMTFKSGMQLWATEAISPGDVYNSERDYRIYGGDETSRNIYRTKDGNFCFFAERWGIDDDELIGSIKCGKSEEVKVD